MTRRARALLLAVSGLGCVVLGAVVVLRWTAETSRVETAAPPLAVGPSPATSGAVAPAPADGDVEITITPEAVARGGIKTAEVTAGALAALVTTPGTVMSHAYREVKVTPVAGGIVTQVHVELGGAVRRGAPLATLSSTDLADAQTRYLSMVASLAADHRKLERTQKLVAIGAASQQELEEVTAIHASRETDVEAARQRLLILGLSAEEVMALRKPSQVVSTITVPAPIDGIVTARAANLGQVVGVGQELFVVTDLSEVWAVGDLYEQDFPAVRAGLEAAVTTSAYPDMRIRGRVSYIDPRVDPQTRTAKVRVEVPNREGHLRLGMYVTIAFTTGGQERAILVPRTAVQAVGDRQVVFVPAGNEEGKFVQRTVRLGPASGQHYVVRSGLRPGDIVVTEGSFLLRAEGARNAPSG
jgi:RND family efflux transporter MFP subunit